MGFFSDLKAKVGDAIGIPTSTASTTTTTTTATKTVPTAPGGFQGLSSTVKYSIVGLFFVLGIFFVFIPQKQYGKFSTSQIGGLFFTLILLAVLFSVSVYFTDRVVSSPTDEEKNAPILGYSLITTSSLLGVFVLMKLYFLFDAFNNPSLISGGGGGSRRRRRSRSY